MTRLRIKLRRMTGPAGATESIIDALIAAEGGFVDHAADRGGATNFGITRKTLAAWRRRAVAAGDVRALSEDEARAIYREWYVAGPCFDRIEDIALREQVIDAGVLHGTGWAARRLQEIAGVRVDGIIGPVTLKAVNFAGKTNGLAHRFAARRIRKIARIVAHDPTQLRFLVGWIGRATSFLET